MKTTAPRRGPGRSLETTASLLAVVAVLAAVLALYALRLNRPQLPAAVAVATSALPEANVLLAATAVATDHSASTPTTFAPEATEPPPAVATSTVSVAAISPSTATSLPLAQNTAAPQVSPTLAAPAVTATAVTPTALPATAVPTTAPTAVPTNTPDPTPIPTATVPPTPLTVRNDQGCLKPQTNQLYIFGELANQTSTAYDVYSLSARVFGPAGELGVASQWFDLPGDFYVAPNTTLPFVVVAQLDQAQFSHYTIDQTVEATERTPRADLLIEEFAAEAVDGQLEVSGRWVHSGPQPDRFVSIVAATYDDQGRVSNMNYLYMTSTISLVPGLPAGQHLFELNLPPSPCAAGTLAVSILGE